MILTIKPCGVCGYFHTEPFELLERFFYPAAIQNTGLNAHLILTDQHHPPERPIPLARPTPSMQSANPNCTRKQAKEVVNQALVEKKLGL